VNETTVKPAKSGLQQRALTALVLAPLAVLGVLKLPTGGFALALAAVFAIGLWEWSAMAGCHARWQRGLFVLMNLLVIAWLWTAAAQSLRIALGIGLGFWLLVPIWLRCFEFAHGDQRGAVTLKLLAGSLAVVPAWSAGVYLHGSSHRGAFWVLFLLVLIWCADVFAYLCGRQFGRRKLAPRISPGKTWAGVYGAFGGAILYAWAGASLLGLAGSARWSVLALAALTVAFSIIGDLFESLIKRHAGCKDSGQLFPGHGGVFDRFDSLFAALPVFTAGLIWLHL